MSTLPDREQLEQALAFSERELRWAKKDVATLEADLAVVKCQLAAAQAELGGLRMAMQRMQRGEPRNPGHWQETEK